MAWTYRCCWQINAHANECVNMQEVVELSQKPGGALTCAQGHSLSLLFGPPAVARVSGSVGRCDGGGRGGCNEEVDPSAGYYHCDVCQRDSCRRCAASFRQEAAEQQGGGLVVVGGIVHAASLFSRECMFSW